MKVQIKDHTLELIISRDIIHQALLNPKNDSFTSWLQGKNIHDLFYLQNEVLDSSFIFYYELFLKAYFQYLGINFEEKTLCFCFPHLKLHSFTLEEFQKKQQSVQCFTCDPKKFVHKSSFLCRCFKKTKEEILQEIQHKGYVTLEELKDHFQVGSKCGSCQKDLKKLLFDDFFLQGQSKIECYLKIQDCLEEFFFQSPYKFQIERLTGTKLFLKIQPHFPVQERLELHLRTVTFLPLQCVLT